jgi:glycine hydroxymethyltransferase
MKGKDMEKVADWIIDALGNIENETRLKAIRKEVELFARQFPIFAW